MQRVNTQAIVLARTNFGEADRIITFLTPDHGKLSGMVKGVRKTKSKLAGGIELFSVSDITFIPGRGEVSTIISTRLVRHYGNIVGNLDRTNAGYEFIKVLNRVTEDSPEAAYFNLLDETFAALNDNQIGLELIQSWFFAQLLKLAGHTPNLQTDGQGEKLAAAKKYSFNIDDMGFQSSASGRDSLDSVRIKLLRLLFGDNRLGVLAKISDVNSLAGQLQPLVRAMAQAHIRL